MKEYNIVNIDGEEVAIKNEEYWQEVFKKKFKIFYKRSNIPKNYWDINFEDYKGKESSHIKERCVKYAEGCRLEKFHNINLYLVGEFGSQKTMLACNIGKEFIKQGLKVKFIFASELIDKLMKTQGFTYIPEIEQEIKELTNVDLLIIDDIFDRNKSTFWQNSSHLVITAWDKFLRRQIAEDKRIVVTSNVSMCSMEDEFGKAIHELISRNFIEFICYDNITKVRKERLSDKIWED